jgi:hypothetical protein
LRILLLAGGPGREYQFVRQLLAAEVETRKVELAVCLQGADAGSIPELPPDRVLEDFPALSREQPKNRFENLLTYDVVIAIDPDWSLVGRKKSEQFGEWVRHRQGGLVLVAGPVHTPQLAKTPPPNALKPLLDLYPVRLKEPSPNERGPDGVRPYALSFPGAGDQTPYLRLDPEGKGPLAGWSEFFFDTSRKHWQTLDEQPVRGFYSCYPVAGVKAGARVVGLFRVPGVTTRLGGQDLPGLPYLVTMAHGSGRVVYLGSGEIWRLRQYHVAFHRRFWDGLVRQVAGDIPSKTDRGEQTPSKEEQKAAEDRASARGLDWLADQQQRDGRWTLPDGRDPVVMTALVGQTFLMEGSTQREGKYAANIRRAIDSLLAHRQRNGLIGNPTDPVEGQGRSLLGHAHALTFLAEVYGEEENADRRKQLAAALERAVAFAVTAQGKQGGWGDAAAEAKDQANVGVTICMLRGLRAVRNAGLPVPRTCTDEARTFLVKTVRPQSPPEVAAAIACGWGVDEYNSPAIKKWLRGFKANAPLPGTSGKGLLDEYAACHYAQVVYRLGEAGYARLFPDADKDEPITWNDYRREVFPRLVQTQNRDGSWGVGRDKVITTVTNLGILLVDRQPLPGISR